MKVVGLEPVAPPVTPPHLSPPTPSRNPPRATALVPVKSGTETIPHSVKRTELSAPKERVTGCEAENDVVVPKVAVHTSYSK